MKSLNKRPPLFGVEKRNTGVPLKSFCYSFQSGQFITSDKPWKWNFWRQRGCSCWQTFLFFVNCTPLFVKTGNPAEDNPVDEKNICYLRWHTISYENSPKEFWDPIFENRNVFIDQCHRGKGIKYVYGDMEESPVAEKRFLLRLEQYFGLFQK